MVSNVVKRYNPFHEPIPDVLTDSVRCWISWMKALFSLRPPGNYRWLPNMSETEIVIIDQGPYNIESPNKRPAIITTLGPSTWAMSGISQMESTFPGIPNAWQINFLGMISAAIGINVVAREGAEARTIAYHVFRMIPVFEKLLQRKGLHGVSYSLVIGQESSAGALVQGSSAPEWKLVTVQAPFMLHDYLEMEENTPGSVQEIVQQITMQMDVLLAS